MALFDLPIEDLRVYRPEIAEPADFDAFWDSTMAQARAAGGEVVIERIAESLPGVDIFDMTFPGFDGQPIKAWYSRPAGADGDLPVVVQFHGYGGGRGLPHEHTFWPSAGFAHVMMDNRGQGSSWGNGGDTPDLGAAGLANPGYMTRGIESPESYYFRRLYTDAARCVEAARTLPGVDASRTFVLGGSQGGAMTIAAAALVPDITAAMPDVAFMCHIRRGTEITDSDPFGEVRRYLSIHRDIADEAFHTLSYFDGVNLAKRGQAPALWSVGLYDPICPPSTTYAAFNWYGAASAPDVRKEMVVYPYNEHEGGSGHQGRRQWLFARELLG